MTRNQLPEGVGKKIVEALKRQAEADITPVDSEENSLNTSIPLTDMQDLPNLNFDAEENNEITENVIVEEEPSPAIEQVNAEQPDSQDVMNRPVFNALNDFSTTASFEEKKPSIAASNLTLGLPQNVAILRNLIASLPVGVSKQTGAQIIRQTLEAMGLPMNSVLKEAQEIQEQLNTSTRECMLKIQEYKTNILQLEQSVQEYQKNISQINDLISLFVLTDRK